MIGYLSNIVNHILQYVKLAVTLTLLLVTLVNYMSYKTKIKCGEIDSDDILHVATSVVLLIFTIVAFYII